MARSFAQSHGERFILTQTPYYWCCGVAKEGAMYHGVWSEKLYPQGAANCFIFGVYFPNRKHEPCISDAVFIVHCSSIYGLSAAFVGVIAKVRILRASIIQPRRILASISVALWMIYLGFTRGHWERYCKTTVHLRTTASQTAGIPA